MNDQRWHAEVRVDIRRTDRDMCVRTPEGSDYPALARAKDWLANEMTEDFKRYAADPRVRKRMIDIADDHKAYDGRGKGWEGWFTIPSEEPPYGTLIHYRLTPCEGGTCDSSEETHDH